VSARLQGWIRSLPDRHGGLRVLIPLIVVVLVGLGIRIEYAANRVEGQPEDSQK
jgi:hypothetical protein